MKIQKIRCCTQVVKIFINFLQSKLLNFMCLEKDSSKCVYYHIPAFRIEIQQVLFTQYSDMPELLCYLIFLVGTSLQIVTDRK